jgi:hypothetical protein
MRKIYCVGAIAYLKFFCKLERSEMEMKSFVVWLVIDSFSFFFWVLGFGFTVLGRVGRFNQLTWLIN